MPPLDYAPSDGDGTSTNSPPSAITPGAAQLRRHVTGVAAIAAAVAGALLAASLSRLEPTAHAPSQPPAQASVSAAAGVPQAESVRSRGALARAVLQRQKDALNDKSRFGYLSTWDPQSARAVQRSATIFANLDVLGAIITRVRDVTGEAGALSPAEQRRLRGVDAWTAEVELAWRLPAFDARPAAARLTYTFVRRAGGVYVADVQASPGSRPPAWLLGSLVVRRSDRTLAAAPSVRAAVNLNQQLLLAVTDVSRVVPTWRGGLVAYEPRTLGQFEALLGAVPGAYDDIAAVTATVDGSSSPASSVAIVVNPVLFDRLNGIGSHVVISHEATHAATGAAAADVPLWLAEGFADYVGVGSVGVPLSVSAAAVVRDLRSRGIPRSLPSDAEFTAASADLDVSYGQAWLAAKLIARKYGEERLVAFYEHVVAAPDDVRRAWRTELGTTRGRLTHQWQRYLEKVARAG